MDYDLSGLSSRSFEQLAQALAAKVLGPGMIVFGDGPDGGREAAIDARVPYPTEGDNWHGYIVMQAKFRQRSQGTTADGRWVIEQLRKELAMYEPSSALPRTPPEYLIFVTNVTLSAVQDSGAKDKLMEIASRSFLRGFDVWDYDKLRVYLDQFQDVRSAFGAFISTGDVLAESLATLKEIKAEQPDFDDVMSRFLQKELLADRWANLEQAGRTAEEQVPVSRVFVDLPVFDERQADSPDEDEGLIPGFVASVMDAAGRRLDPETQTLRPSKSPLGRSPVPPDGRFVLLGGPGQGKSTICQFVCQMFRASLLRSRPPGALAPEVKEVMSTLEEHLRDEGLALPTARRFPIRVELSRFADDLADPAGADSLLGYIASVISRRVGMELRATTLMSWLGRYPSAIVLDGLDEVPLSRSREGIVRAIQEFWVDMSHCKADCLVIATSRPQGYSDEFSPRHYQHLWLAPLSAPRALHYSRRLLAARFTADPDRQERILERLRRALTRPDTGRLMTTPLQVTIMATLLDRMGQPPVGRWNLFSRYYRVVYDRELEREIPAASVLRDYKPDIDAIHRRVGLLLQAESESERQSEPQISRERFAEIVKARLRDEEHELENEPELIEQIITAATDRLVFLVGVESDQVGFEIRSLQEFMAAEALLRGGETLVEQRLRRVGGLLGWRNVFLFAAGRCFADLQHLRDTVHTICLELNDPESDPLAAVTMPGSGLAIDLLADGVAHNQPRYERLLGREALRVLRRAPDELNDRLAEVCRPSLRRTYEEELSTALAARPFSAALGAWRTLAVLLARSEEWALPLLASRVPEPEDAKDLLDALPAAARSEKLARWLADACVKAPPEDSISCGSSLASLGVLEAVPLWFREFVRLTTSGSSRNSPGGEFRPSAEREGVAQMNVRPLRDSWGPLQRAARSVTSAERNQAPRSWAPFFATLAFSESLSAQVLAEELALLAGMENFIAVSRYNYGPWPLSALIASAEGREDLERFSEAVRDGQLGDYEDWSAAERRWKRSGVSLADIAHAGEEDLPWDRSIGAIGFPLVATLMTVYPPYSAAARTLLGWLEEIHHLPTRRHVMQGVLWLAKKAREDKGSQEQLSASAVARRMKEGDVEQNLGLELDVLNALEWNRPLGPEEIRMLDRWGNTFRALLGRRAADFLELPLRSSMVDAWERDPDLSGLYRLLAIGWPTPADPSEEKVLRLLAHEREGLECARALLAVKAGRSTEQDWETIVDGEELMWLSLASETLTAPGASAFGEASIPVIDSLVPPARWKDKQLVGAVGGTLIAARSSGLMEDEVWSSLGLFERPCR